MSEPTAPDLTGRPRLNWEQAVEAMRRGSIVRRARDCYLKPVEARHDPDEHDDHEWASAAVYESGQEGCYLAHAWTADEKPALIFMGASSKCLFVPDGDHRSAVDWVEVAKHEA